MKIRKVERAREGGREGERERGEGREGRRERKEREREGDYYM